jgi:hypothetical protein
MRRTWWAVAMLASILPLAGCRDDSRAVSATEFQKRANAICKAKCPDPFPDFNELAGDLGLDGCTAKQEDNHLP